MTQPGTTLILPVENQVREFDAKLLLALAAADRGFRVVIGSRNYVHFAADSLPRGVYLAKSMRALSSTMFDILDQLGHRIVALDEEGLVRPIDRWYYERRLSAKTMKRTAALLAWGPSNAETLEAFPDRGNVPIVVTGNPRVDMLRPECLPYYQPEADRIRAEYGPFLLVNSNFGHVNHYVADLRLEVPREGAYEDFASALAAHRSTIFEHFQEMLPALCRSFPQHRVVLRPHPIESPARWAPLAASQTNLTVASGGNVAPWLMSCDALVQNGCQTAIEAFLIGAPTVSYKPVSSALDVAMIDDLTHVARDLSSLTGLLQRALAGDLAPPNDAQTTAHLRHNLAALEGPLACESILDVIEQTLEAGPIAAPALPQRAYGRARNRVRTRLKQRRARRAGSRASVGTGSTGTASPARSSSNES